MFLLPPSLSYLTLIPLFLLSLTQPATTSPLNTSSELPSIPDLLRATRPSCADIPSRPDWFQASERFDVGDCEEAMKLFHNDYVRDHNGIRYEFLASGIEPVHGMPTQRVPLRVASGTCTIVIAMRSEFTEGQLPNETPKRSARSDVSSFGTLFTGVRKIYEQCVAEESQPGWYESGDLNSIAVLIWQSASKINQEIRHHRASIDDRTRPNRNPFVSTE